VYPSQNLRHQAEDALGKEGQEELREKFERMNKAIHKGAPTEDLLTSADIKDLCKALCNAFVDPVWTASRTNGAKAWMNNSHKERLAQFIVDTFPFLGRLTEGDGPGRYVSIPTKLDMSNFFEALN
jgi:hypothetical protein